MTTAQFDDIRNGLHVQAMRARTMANKFDSKTWHALADRLFEALDQADNMDQVVIPVKP